MITAAAGDEGYLNWTEAKEAEKSGKTYYEGADYPASSPHVVAVGGTSLTLSDNTRQSETVWNDGEGAGGGGGGGGCSQVFTAQEWQQDVADWSTVGCENRRAVADVSADANPETGVAVYDSVPYPEEQKGKIVTSELGWVPIGGTSVASPIIASMFALAGGAHSVEYPAETLYSHLGSASLYDVTEGGNGKCDDDYVGCFGSLSSSLDCGQGALICNAAAGYDGPTGVGTPNGIAAFEPVSEEAKRKTEEKQRAEAKLREEERKKEEETRNQGGGPGGSGTGGGSAGSGSGGGGSTTGGSTTGVSNASAGGKSGSSSGTTGSSSGASSNQPTIKLTAFALTPTALLALNRARPKTSSVHFAFIISAAARVRATLARLVRVRGHNRWELVVPSTLTFTAVKGRNRRSLTNHSALTQGRYRLTLTPEHGAAHTLKFNID